MSTTISVRPFSPSLLIFFVLTALCVFLSAGDLQASDTSEYLPDNASTPVTMQQVGTDARGVYIRVMKQPLRAVLQAIQNRGGPRFSLDTRLERWPVSAQISAKNWTLAVRRLLGRRFSLLAFYDDRQTMEKAVIMPLSDASSSAPYRGGSSADEPDDEAPADEPDDATPDEEPMEDASTPPSRESPPPPPTHEMFPGDAFTPPGVDPSRVGKGEGPPLDRSDVGSGPPLDRPMSGPDGPPIGRPLGAQDGPPLGRSDTGEGPPGMP